MMCALVVAQERYLALANNLWGIDYTPSGLTCKTFTSFLPNTSYSYLWPLVHIWKGSSPTPIHHSQAASALASFLNKHLVCLLNQASVGNTYSYEQVLHWDYCVYTVCYPHI